jgi:hypothetical protein
MDLEDLKRKLSLAGRHIFMKINYNAAEIKKKYTDPNVYVMVNGKKIKITDITVNECNIYLETENE